MNKGFFILYFVIVIFSVLIALFFAYSQKQEKEQDLILNYSEYSNKVTEQTIVENNVSYFIKKNIEKELNLTQERTIIKEKIDPIIKDYLLKKSFLLSNFNTSFFIEIIPLEKLVLINYQYVFISEIKNEKNDSLIPSGAVYAGQVVK